VVRFHNGFLQVITVGVLSFHNFLQNFCTVIIYYCSGKIITIFSLIQSHFESYTAYRSSYSSVQWIWGHLAQVPWPYIPIISMKSCRLDGKVVKRFMHYVSTGPTAREFEPHRSQKKKKKETHRKGRIPSPNMGGSLTFYDTAIVLS
jgi:hypothetical protein